MIFILACFDLAVVVVIHPLIIIESISRWLSVDVVKDWVQHTYILFDFSFYALLTMTLERYLALVYPFFHERMVKKSRLMTAFVLFQLPIDILWTLPGKYHPLEVILYAVHGIFFLVICILNIKLFFLARTLRDRAVINLGSLDRSNSEPRNNLDSNKFKVAFFSLGKISTCLLAVLCLVLCYLPWYVYLGVQESNLSISEQNKFIIERWTETLSALNSSLNCLIFFYKNSVLRRHGKNFWKNFICGRVRLNKKFNL